MRVLVTGCAGFIGSHLTDALLARGDQVIGVDCFNDNYQRPQKLRNLDHQARDLTNFDFVPIDLAAGDLDDLVEAVDIVYHLAAEPGVRQSWGARFERYVTNNVVATQRLLEAVRRHSGRTLVYASSSSIYGDAESFPTPEDVIPRPKSPYGTTKLSGEHLCRLYGANYSVETVILRYFTVYGPRQRPDMAFHRFCLAALDGEPLTIYGDGRQTRDFTYVADIVAGTLAAGAADVAAGRTYNLGGGAQTSVRDVLNLLGAVAERSLNVVYQPSEHGDVRDTAADISRARAELGFRPHTPIEEGLRAEFEWLATGFHGGGRTLLTDR
jgi:UDP-glucuronate 4-epimerase